jgi:hypothetical protein
MIGKSPDIHLVDAIAKHLTENTRRRGTVHSRVRTSLAQLRTIYFKSMWR